MPKPESLASDSMSEALNLMMSALKTLDECDSPGVVGAHLDLAIARLREHLGILEPSEWSHQNEDLNVCLDTTSAQVVSC